MVAASALITDEYTGLPNGGTDTGIPYLKGSVGDRMWVTVRVDVSWDTLDCPMKFDSGNQTITRSDCVLTSSRSFVVDGFVVGDTIEVAGTAGGANDGSYEVVAVSASMLQVKEGISTTGAYSSVSVYGTTPITGLDYYDNCVSTENPDGFTSLFDTGNTRKMSIDGITTSSGSTTMNFVGASKAWQDGSITVTGNGTSGYVQSFTIVRKFDIVPYYTADQLTALKLAIDGTIAPPDYFSDVNCLGYIYQVDCRYSKGYAVTQSTGVVTASQPYVLGNTGWFDEFLNGGDPEYSLVSITYTNHTTSASMDTIDWNQQVDVAIVLHSASGHFTDESKEPYILGTPFVVNWMWLPLNESEYQNQKTNAQQTFCKDRAFCYVGADKKNGTQHGGNYQVLSNIQGIYGSANQVTINATINMSTFLKNFFAGKAASDLNYMIWITPQKESILTLADTDRNAVLCDVNMMATNYDNPDLFTIITQQPGGGETTDVLFYNTPDIAENAQTDINMMGGDWSYFQCDFEVPQGTNINDIGIRFQAVLYDTNISDKFNNILQTADLERFINNTAGSFDGVQNNINIAQATAFPGSSGNPRASKTIYRNASLDSDGNLGYSILYGFQAGYKYWQQVITGVNEFAAVGTNMWSGYFTGSDLNGGTLPENSDVRFDLLITWHITDPETGLVTEFNKRCQVTPGDTGMNVAGITPELLTYDTLGNSLGGVIPNDQQCEVVFLFNYSGSAPTPPSGYSFRANLLLWYDDGKSQTTDENNSYDGPADNSLWLTACSIDTSGDTYPNAIAVSALLDPTLVENGLQQYRLICNLQYQHD